MSTIPSFENTKVAFSHKSNNELRKAYYLFRVMNNNTVVSAGSVLTNWALRLHLPIGGIIKPTVYQQFCGGETLEKSSPTIAQLAKYDVKVLLDYGVEAKESEQDFDQTVDSLLQAIAYAKGNDNVSAISCKITGLAKFKLLEKYKIECAEVSDGSIVMPHEKKCEYISKLSKDFTVLSEVGSKEEGILISPARWIKMMQTNLNQLTAIRSKYSIFLKRK